MSNGKEYIPLYFVQSTGTNVEIEIGVNFDLQWINRRGSNVSFLSVQSPSEEAFSWLVLLELKCDDVYSSLRQNLIKQREVLKEKGLDEEKVLKSFPVENIILCGLKTRTSNWTNMALDWLANCVSDKFFSKNILEEVVSDKKIAQHIRHKAHSLLRNILRK